MNESLPRTSSPQNYKKKKIREILFLSAEFHFSTSILRHFRCHGLLSGKLCVWRMKNTTKQDDQWFFFLLLLNEWMNQSTVMVPKNLPLFITCMRKRLEWFERRDLVATIRRHQGQIPDEPPTLPTAAAATCAFLEDPLSFNNCRSLKWKIVIMHGSSHTCTGKTHSQHDCPALILLLLLWNGLLIW